MADNTIIQQGRFVADGTAEVIKLRSDVDWFRTYNYTVTAAGGAATGVETWWMKGMAADTGFIRNKLAADDSTTAEIMATGGYSYINTATDDELSAVIASTGITAAAPPLLTMAATAGVLEGNVLRIGNHPGALQFGGVDFEIGTVVANTSAELVYAPTPVATVLAGQFRLVNIPRAFYPRNRFISAVTAANPGVITTTVSHGYTVGQKLSFRVPAEFGMVQLDGLVATVTAVTASTITTDIDTSGFTAFAWPLTAGVPFTHAQVIPVGEDSGSAYANLLDDATLDNGYIAMHLAAGTTSPAGAANDVIYWQAGKSFSVTNE
jgi:hypothetical protein